MRPSLRYALLATDALFLAYWLVAGLAELGLVSLPASLMYAGYGDARVCAWNWSFFPLDVAFSVSGLLAVRWARRDDARWRPAALLSLTLTMVAGLMAVSYWALMGEFVASWFLPNLLLVVWPIPYLAALLRDVARLGRTASVQP
jgi:hypothetical protein